MEISEPRSQKDKFFNDKGYTDEFLNNIKKNSDQLKGAGKINLIIKS